MFATLWLPVWYILLSVFVFGVIIGSFLNVVIYRFHTGKSLAGFSHCLSCQTRLHWYELLPLVSYLGLRGRCRTCHSRIPSRYFLVELLTGVLFVLVALTKAFFWWPLAWLLMAVLVVVLVYDIYHLIIPNAFVGLLLFIAVANLAMTYWLVPDLNFLLTTVAAGLIGYGFFALLWWLSDGRWLGYGDAKLALPLAMLVGLTGVFSMIVLAFWIGAIISLVIMLINHLTRTRGQKPLRFLARTLTMKSEVPFAPFLIAGFLAVYLGQADVLTFVTYVLPF